MIRPDRRERKMPRLANLDLPLADLIVLFPSAGIALDEVDVSVGVANEPSTWIVDQGPRAGRSLPHGDRPWVQVNPRRLPPNLVEPSGVRRHLVALVTDAILDGSCFEPTGACALLQDRGQDSLLDQLGIDVVRRLWPALCRIGEQALDRLAVAAILAVALRAPVTVEIDVPTTQPVPKREVWKLAPGAWMRLGGQAAEIGRAAIIALPSANAADVQRLVQEGWLSLEAGECPVLGPKLQGLAAWLFPVGLEVTCHVPQPEPIHWTLGLPARRRLGINTSLANTRPVHAE